MKAQLLKLLDFAPGSKFCPCMELQNPYIPVFHRKTLSVATAVAKKVLMWEGALRMIVAREMSNFVCFISLLLPVWNCLVLPHFIAPHFLVAQLPRSPALLFVCLFIYQSFMNVGNALKLLYLSAHLMKECGTSLYFIPFDLTTVTPALPAKLLAQVSIFDVG